jgi:tetratricopeptide (TPR) repeat protein
MTMHITPLNAAAVAKDATAALRRGDAAGARAGFERLAAAGLADLAAWYGLAHACQALGDTAAALDALEHALAAAPDNLQLLLMKGDLLAASGKASAAVQFYRAVLKVAPPPEELPPELAAHLARARAQCAQYAGQFEAHLLAHVRAAGLDGERDSARFAASLDLLLGKKEVYLQQPRLYYFPGLPQTQFFERADFPWLDQVEAATDDIRAELLAVLEEEGAFAPYVQLNPNLPAINRGGMHNNPAWSAFYLWRNGELVAENAARCPKTLAALAGVPMTDVPGRAPTVLFSLMRPGAHIPPHTGILNTRLICHLPLIVPPGCSFRVGNETRSWEEGKAWVFDDTIEHEAWNRSAQPRVILLFEAWRPELTAKERTLVSAMLASIDGFGERGADWDM